MRQFLLFCMAGTLGFVVDAGVVSCLVNGFGLNPYFARLLSFLCAVAATFAFNRRYTFVAAGSQPLWRQWSQYLVAMTGGFIVNYGAYALLVYRFELVRQWPVVGVAVGSMLGLVVNFLSSRYWVFRHRDEQRQVP